MTGIIFTLLNPVRFDYYTIKYVTGFVKMGLKSDFATLKRYNSMCGGASSNLVTVLSTLYAIQSTKF